MVCNLTSCTPRTLRLDIHVLLNIMFFLYIFIVLEKAREDLTLSAGPKLVNTLSHLLQVLLDAPVSATTQHCRVQVHTQFELINTTSAS